MYAYFNNHYNGKKVLRQPNHAKGGANALQIVFKPWIWGNTALEKNNFVSSD